MNEQSGADISISLVPALSSALHYYFCSREQTLGDSLAELLTFCTHRKLQGIDRDLFTLGSRGVSLESSLGHVFRFGRPALARYSELFGLSFKADEAASFFVGLGAAIRFTLFQAPSYQSEIIGIDQLQQYFPALKRVFASAANKNNLATPSSSKDFFSSAELPSDIQTFYAQLSYELESLIDDSRIDSRVWRVEEAAIQKLARAVGSLGLIDPYACLQSLYNEVRNYFGRETHLIQIPSVHDRMEIAKMAVDLFFSSKELLACTSESLRISMGERSDL